MVFKSMQYLFATSYHTIFANMEILKLFRAATLTLGFLQCFSTSAVLGALRTYDWILSQTNITRLCKTQEVVTVNGMFPGPTIEVQDGDSLVVDVHNSAKYNATIHWHGIWQLRNCWADGVAYVTQCPIRPGGNFTYRFEVSGQHGTLWWHAHYSWLRATVHGAFIIHPKESEGYPYAHPGREETIILGEWWNTDPMQAAAEMDRNGGTPRISDSLLINSYPGNLAPCSSSEGSSVLRVSKGETVLLRIINAALYPMMFFKIANHTVTVVAADAQYTNPFKTEYLIIDPGQTTDVLFTADQPDSAYYISVRAYWLVFELDYDNTTATAILEYSSVPTNSTPKCPPDMPYYNDTDKAENFHRSLRSLNSRNKPLSVPQDPVDENLFYVEMPGRLPFPESNKSEEFLNFRASTSLNNVSFKLPSIAILEAYYFNLSGVFTKDFPDVPPKLFNFTDTNRPDEYLEMGTRVKVLKFNASVQMILQNTGLLQGEGHSFHLHGHDFYVVGRGFGNYDPLKDPEKFNLVDPPKRNTLDVPFHGWAAIRFIANNPGAWFFHCHIDWHMATGMAMAFITLDGEQDYNKLNPPLRGFPLCSKSHLSEVTNSSSTTL